MMLRKLYAVWSKIILPTAISQPSAEAGCFQWLWFFLKPYHFIFIPSFVLRVIRFTFVALVTYVFSLLIDEMQSGRALSDQQGLWLVIAKVAAFYFVVLISHIFLFYETAALDNAQRGLTLYSINHIMKLPLDWHEQQGSGGKLQRIMQARENLKQIYFMFARHVIMFIGELAGLVIALVAMKLPVTMLGLFFGYMVSYMVVFWTINHLIDKWQDQHNALKEMLVSRIYDFVSLIRVAKNFLLEKYVGEKSLQAEKDGHQVMRKIRFANQLRWTLINGVVWFWCLLIVVFGLRQFYADEVTIGGFSAAIFLAYRMRSTLEDIVVAQAEYYDVKSGFLRIRDTLSVPVQNYDIEPVVKMSADWSGIECKDLSFAYNERQPVLQNIDLTIPRGKRIALIGHSGAGKSTLVKLLMKQNLPNGGSIMVGDTDLNHIASEDWLRHLALVPQDVELINATLRENVLLDQQDIDEDFYRDCLHKAYLEEFVNSLPQGDRTEVGERGVKLSGGQRQRLGIARALVRKAEIIIFDEATSSLDSESEAHIQAAMQESFADKTVILIAHRLSTIRQADMIYVLDQGRVAESGTFKELEAVNGIFARLWTMQSGGFLVV